MTDYDLEMSPEKYEVLTKIQKILITAIADELKEEMQYPTLPYNVWCI